MKTQVIPAQITTVEDKIAGNLNLTQIMLLLFPAFWTTVIFTVLSPRLHFTLYKLPLVLVVLILCLVLALRIKGKVVLSWVITILHYNLRPKYYVFNKNDTFMRSLDVPDLKNKVKVQAKKAEAKVEIRTKPLASIGDLLKLDGLLSNPKYSFSFKSTKKGGMNVAFKQEQK
ncbi:MAG: hypothetical protein WD231_02745 [Candidatus Woykebacteria bacterium]